MGWDDPTDRDQSPKTFIRWKTWFRTRISGLELDNGLYIIYYNICLGGLVKKLEDLDLHLKKTEADGTFKHCNVNIPSSRSSRFDWSPWWREVNIPQVWKMSLQRTVYCFQLRCVAFKTILYLYLYLIYIFFISYLYLIHIYIHTVYLGCLISVTTTTKVCTKQNMVWGVQPSSTRLVIPKSARTIIIRYHLGWFP